MPKISETLSLIRVDEDSHIPKYRQIVESVIDNIATGQFEVGQKIPSINKLSERYLLSRDTVEKAYNVLKEREIINSVKGKGFYVMRTPLIGRKNVLFLVNKLSNYKMRIYEAFREALGEDYHTNLVVYHCEVELFVNLLQKHAQAYDYFVIMPHFRTKAMRHVSTTEAVTAAIEQIPPHRRFILDNRKVDFGGKYGVVFQDFEEDLYQALVEGGEKISKYAKLVIAHPTRSLYPYPRRILFGFRKFCVEAKLPFEVIDEVNEGMPLAQNTLYLTLAESDLVNLMRAARDQQLTPGKDIGIISYNETPLKDLLGISTVSTDFDAMGRSVARLVAEGLPERLHNPFVFTDRSSL